MKLRTFIIVFFSLGCAPSPYLVAHKPIDRFDAIIVPGCPSEEDGSPSQCQLGRAGQAALLWKQGWTHSFIVSGSDVHTPYVEAEAIAQVMTVLGVPSDRIVLERDALHSDENVYYSMLVANKLDLTHLAIASNEPMGSLMCKMMTSWGHACASIDMDIAALHAFMPPYDKELHALRARHVTHWVPLAAREARIALTNGYGRPPSYILYPLYGALGHGHKPIAPAHEPITWDDLTKPD